VKSHLIDELEQTIRELKESREVERMEAQQTRRRLEKKLRSLRERIAAEVGDGDSNSVDETSRSGLSSDCGGGTSAAASMNQKCHSTNTKRTRQELQRQITALQHVSPSPHSLTISPSSFLTIFASSMTPDSRSLRMQQ
jgi:dynactin complex subunit